ncbi:MAG: hypothetical protein ACP5J3_12195, partial [Pyrobaculum sp.]
MSDWVAALHLAATLSALYLLLWRGDEEWYFPIFAVVTVVWAVPLVTGFVLQFSAPYVPNPLYIYGFYEAPGGWAERIRATAEAARLAAEAAASALEGAAVASSVLQTLMFLGAVAAAPLTGGGSLAAAVFALAAWRYMDPVFQLANAAYQAAVGVYMVFHLLEILASWAEKWFGLLMAAGLFLLLFPRVRTWGAFLTALALALYTAAAVGAYLSPFGLAVAQWAEETAEWAKSAPGSTGSLSYLATRGEGVALLRYHNYFSSRWLVEELNKTWTSLNLSRGVPRFDLLRGVEILAVNGSDWAAAGPGAPAVLYVGRKNFTGLGAGSPYAVYVWLDYPASITNASLCLNYPETHLPNGTMPSGESGERWLRRARAEECRLLSALYPLYVVDTSKPSHWRLLHAGVNATVTYGGELERGERRGAVGVWGWVVKPDVEACGVGNAAGDCRALDVAERPGQLKYDVGWDRLEWRRPVLNTAWSNFSILLPNAPRPVKDGSVDFYKWRRTCEWCCRYVNGTCVEWCSSTREEWQEPRYRKKLETRQLQIATIHLGKPWEPLEVRSGAEIPKVDAAMPYTYRDWEVWHEVKYGDWEGDGEPPPAAYCYVHDNRTYMRIRFWDVQHAARYVYGFVWMRGVAVEVDDRRSALPDEYGDAPVADGDGVAVVNLLRGAEYDQECHVAYYGADEPNWRHVPTAAGNMSKTSRDYFLSVLAGGNYSRRYVEALSRLIPPNTSSPMAEAAGGELGYFASIAPRLFFPMPDLEPRSYKAGQFKILCARFAWDNNGEGGKAAWGRLLLHPGEEVWLFGYSLGDSRATRESISALAERWRWTLAHPPPPPPASLTPRWPIPWNNWTSLPYKPADAPPMPPPDPRWGVSMWDVGLVLNPIELFGTLLGRLWWSIYVALLTPVFVFEALAVVFGFPSASRYLLYIVINVIQDLTYWLGIRLFLKARLAYRLGRAAGSPVKRASARLVRRLAHRGWAKYRERPGERAVRRRFEA